MRGRWSALLAATVVTASICGTHARGAVVQGLGFLPGTSSSFARDVSADGSIVVGESGSGFAARPFRWTSASGIQLVGDLPGSTEIGFAYGISADGSTIVGESSSTEGKQAYRWTSAGGMQGLGDLPGSIFQSTARAASSNGSVVVGYGVNADTDNKSFRWTESGGIQEVTGPTPLASNHTAYDVSADGTVVVGRGIGSAGNEAFRWVLGGGVQALGQIPGGHSSRATSVSPDGSVVVGYGSHGTTGSRQAFRWTSATGVKGLGDLPGVPFASFASAAYGVSADGNVIVGQHETAAGGDAIIWNAAPQNWRLLKDVIELDLSQSLSGWTLQAATGISSDGMTIIGWGKNPAGAQEAFVVKIPEPSAVALTPMALAVALRRRRRRLGAAAI